MPPTNQATAASVVVKKKAPILVQLAAVVIILPTALGMFAVGSQLLSGFDPIAAVSTILLLVVLVAAFALFSMKRWALYTVTTVEVIALALMTYGGALSTSTGITVVAIIVAWIYYKDFH